MVRDFPHQRESSGARGSHLVSLAAVPQVRPARDATLEQIGIHSHFIHRRRFSRVHRDRSLTGCYPIRDPALGETKFALPPSSQVDRVMNLRRSTNRHVLALVGLVALSAVHSANAAEVKPNFVLVMADDQGWGQTGYYDHPVLKTPNLDAMAAGGLRFDRFYAGAPVCSPTRASVLTGRTNDRAGTNSHGFPLRRQEVTLAQLLDQAGYATGHFGKWHLNGLRGPGVPILRSDSHHPGRFGFHRWLSVTNFFDRDPILSREGEFEEFAGDSSEIVVQQALKFLEQHAQAEQPSFTVIWFGTPHSPFKASEADQQAFAHLDEASRNHYGELAAMDRSLGTLREGLRKLKIADNTLLWFCSDNGGLPKIKPTTVGPLRGNKGTIYEGGLRVPGIIEWPGGIPSPRITSYPASVLDILPTLLDVVDIDFPDPRPLDGLSLKPLFTRDLKERAKPIPFRHLTRTAWIDNDFKILTNKRRGGAYELYDLRNDPSESTNLAEQHPELFERMKRQLMEWNRSVDASVEGRDYPEGQVNPGEPAPRFWTEVDAYKPYFAEWRDRWEYRSRLTPKKPKKQASSKQRKTKTP